MTKRTFCIFLAVLLLSCNNEPQVASISEKKDTSAVSSTSLPYSVDKEPDWEIGSDENIGIAMAALKSYEMSDQVKLVQTIADSIDFYYDGGHFKGTRDSFLTMLTNHRNNFTNVSIKMQDYESVKSRNRNEEWVSLWYIETTTDKQGKTDSVMTMDDVKIENGKVRVIDTKVRKLAAK